VWYGGFICLVWILDCIFLICYVMGAQVKHFLKNMLSPAAKKGNIQDNTELQEAFQELYEDCLDVSNGRIGLYRKKNVKKIMAETQELWPNSALEQNLTDSTIKTIHDKVKNMPGMRQKDRELPEITQTSISTSYLSKNLAEQELPPAGEGAMCVPGQHLTSHLDSLSGESAFVKFISCHQTLQIFSSVTAPKLLKLQGSDGKEYWWVVKGGEDVRQDERIQQVFRCMNKILAADVQCARRRLKIATYNVMPLSKLVGMIECVRDVASMADVISSNYTLEERVKRKEVQDAYSSTVTGYYIAGIEKAHEPECKMLNDFEGIQKMTPEDCLRRGLMRKVQTAQVSILCSVSRYIQHFCSVQTAQVSLLVHFV
jgi:hypothetical protein